ncbi:MAG: O-antigen ligase family protein [Clostridia bacterium]|nr:O-antigen ligase family protein [Clostridia bacterium]
MRRRSSKSARAEQSKGTATVSLIFFLLDQLWNFFCQKLSNGFFGKIFTSYSKEQKAFDEGFLKSQFVSGNKIKEYFRKLRFYVSGTLEASWFLNFCVKIIRKCLCIPLKNCGSALFSFGIYTVLVYFIRMLVPGLTESGFDFVMTGIGICIVSIPMMLSKDSVASAVGNSVIPRMLFSGGFGFREEHYEAPVRSHRTRGNVLVMAGLLFGALTLFIHPLSIIVLFVFLIALCVVFVTPEIGVLSTIFFLPFFSLLDDSTIAFAVLVLVTGMSYLLKLLRGKRILRMELMDISVVAFTLLLFFSGTITAGGKKGYYEVLLSCSLMLGYFLVVNLMRTEAWLKRLIYAWVSSGTIVALLGIIQYVFGMFGSDVWLDVRYFTNIRGRVTSVFDNPNVLGMYLCMVFPFALYALSRCCAKNEKLLCRISVGIILLCAVLTWSRGAWLAILISALLFALFNSPKTFRVIFFCILAIPFLPMVLPESVTIRFMSIGDMADSSLQYRMYTWKGALRLLRENFWGGIGYGNTAFREIYPQYAYAGIEAAEHSHNLFLQIMIGMGIGGLIVFLAVLLLGAQMNLEYIKNTKDLSTRLMVVSALCSFVAILIMGLFDFVWYNYRLFFLFWVVLAMACAGTRIGNAEQQRHSFVAVSDDERATLDLNV